MSGSVSTLKELVTDYLVSDPKVDHIHPALPAELIENMGRLSGEVPLSAASEFAAEYLDLTRSFAALWDAFDQHDVIMRFLPAYEQLQARYNRSAQALLDALAVAVSAGGQSLVPALTTAQEQVNNLGHYVKVMVNGLRMLARGAATMLG